MTPELNKTDGLPDAAEPDVTKRINAGAAEQTDAAEPEEKRTAFSSLRAAAGPGGVVAGAHCRVALSLDG